MMTNLVLLAVVIRIIDSIIVIGGNAYLRFAKPGVITLYKTQRNFGYKYTMGALQQKRCGVFLNNRK